MTSKRSRSTMPLAALTTGRPEADAPRPRASARAAWIPAALVPVVLAGGALFAPPSSHADEALHLRLVATSPAADSVITESPEEVRLWFSEPPRMRGTAVRLADDGGELLPTTDAIADDEDPTQVFIRPRESLGPGEYTVHWRVIAQDGHAQNGSFGFELRHR